MFCIACVIQSITCFPLFTEEFSLEEMILLSLYRREIPDLMKIRILVEKLSFLLACSSSGRGEKRRKKQLKMPIFVGSFEVSQATKKLMREGLITVRRTHVFHPLLRKLIVRNFVSLSAEGREIVENKLIKRIHGKKETVDAYNQFMVFSRILSLPYVTVKQAEKLMKLETGHNGL